MKTILKKVFVFLCASVFLISAVGLTSCKSNEESAFEIVKKSFGGKTFTYAEYDAFNVIFKNDDFRLNAPYESFYNKGDIITVAEDGKSFVINSEWNSVNGEYILSFNGEFTISNQGFYEFCFASKPENTTYKSVIISKTAPFDWLTISEDLHN